MKRRKMSAEARKAVSRRMKKYWAGLRNPDHTKRAEAMDRTKPTRKRRVVKRAARVTHRTESAPGIDPVTRRSMDYVRAAETAVVNNEIERLIGHIAQAIMLRGPMLQIQDYNLVTWCLRKMVENRATLKDRKTNGKIDVAFPDGPFSGADLTADPYAPDPRD